MADPVFEQTLARLFADTPHAPDAAAFAGRVQARLDRGWALRRGLIAVAGVAGGVVTLAQFAEANLLGRASVASQTVDAQARDAAAELGGRVQPLLNALHAALPVSGEVLWMAGGLMAVAAALVAARLADRW